MKIAFAPFENNPCRYVQDPIHGTIELSELECSVIDHPFTQRLRNIRQLGNASLVFPAATHTRFSHSIGVMHQAGQLCRAIFSNGILKRKSRQGKRSSSAQLLDASLSRIYRRVRLAGLLHDLGHGPYSHHFELFLKAESLHVQDIQKTDFRLPLSWIAAQNRTKYLAEPLRHEHFSYGLIHLLPLETSEKRALISLLDHRFTCGPEMESDLRIVASNAGFESAWPSLLRCLRSLLSSDLDADRLDYLRRDSHFCGLNVGIDTEHLLRSISLAVSHDQFVINVERNSLFAIEQMLLFRKQMFNQVYQNRVNQLMDELLSQAMEHCRREGVLKVPLTVQDFLKMDDQWLYERLRLKLTESLSRGSLETSGELAIAMYLTRTLPVTESVLDADFEEIERVMRRLKKTHSKNALLCLPQKELMAREKRHSKAHSRTRQRGRQNAKAETVLYTAREKDGPLYPITEISELIQSTAWFTPKFRIIATKSLEESAKERKLNEKLLWFPVEDLSSRRPLKASHNSVRAQRA